MPNAKGSILVSLVQILRAQPADSRKHLPESLHKYIDPDMLIATHQWYPEADFMQLMSAAGKLIPPKAGRDPYERMGKALARIHLSGPYKDLIDKDNLWGSVDRSAKLWTVQHDTGHSEMGNVDEYTASYDVVDFESAIPEFCASITGYLRGTMEAFGVDVKVSKRLCRSRDNDRCRWELRYDEPIRGLVAQQKARR